MKTTRSTGQSARTALVTSALALCAVPLAALGQAFTFIPGTLTYSENFDSMGTNAVLVNGWAAIRGAGTNPNGAPLSPLVGIGTGTGGIYNTGSIGPDDRAIGTLASGTTIPYFGASFLNSTGSLITGMSLAGFSELWRAGSNALAETLTFQFSFDATSLSSGTWTDLSAMNLAEPNPTLTTNTPPPDGNLPENRLPVTTGVTPVAVSWLDTTSMWIRWKDANDTGSDALIALDDFSLTVATGVASKSIVWAPASNLWNTIATNWQVTPPTQVAFAPSDIVKFDDSGLAFNHVVVDAGGVGPATVTVDSTGTYTFSGGPIGAVTALLKNGSGTLVLGSVYSGGLNATAGTVRTAANEVFANGAGITLGDGVTFDLDGHSETVGALDLTGATISTGAAGLLTIGGSVTMSSSPTDKPTTITGNLSNGGSPRNYLVVDNAAPEDLILNARLVGGGRVNFDGSAGTVRIGGDNSAFTGGLQLDSGITYVLASTRPVGTGQLFLNGGTVDAAVVLTGANALSAPVSLGGNGVIFTGSNIEFSGALTFFGAGAKTYTISAGQTVRFSGTLDSTQQPGQTTAPNAAMNKAGDGKLVIAGSAAAYDGALTVSAGTVDILATLGTGLASIHDSAVLNIFVSQNLADLTIDDGALVTLVAPPLPAPGEFGGEAQMGGAPAVVPEPASGFLLLSGLATLLGLRRRA